MQPHFSATRLCGGEGGIRTLGTGISQYNGLAIHRLVMNRLQNFILYSSFQRVTNRSIWSVLLGIDSFWSCNHYNFMTGLDGPSG